ncbi:MAG: sulfurtransferase TusA family protein [Deltaproteobacteria bacterium]|nr:sulfurtransferase TusA family protein [Deltaproteobacteria bacterium]
MIVAPETLDLSGVPCPANAARALLRLEGMDPGSLLRIIVDDGEPVLNVPPALEQEGHALLSKEPDAGRWVLLLRRG